MILENPEILQGAMDFKSFHLLVRKEKNPFVLKILYYLYDVYYGLTVPEASKKHEITKDTGYKYVRIWRNEGRNGLIPNYGKGRSAKINEADEIILVDQIKSRKINDVDELLIYILKNFKIIYSKSWAYEFFKDLSLKEGVKYPLSKEEDKKLEREVELEKNENENDVFINDEGLECIKLTKALHFIRHEDINDLNFVMNHEKNHKMLKRYFFINGLNLGLDLEEISKIINISISTARKWLKLWNQKGLMGLVIHWGSGRPAFLTDDQFEQVRKHVINNNISRFSEIHKYILDEFNVDYSMKHLYRLKKTKIKLR
jgi:putative transposase